MILLYVTTSSIQEARKISKSLLQNKLAACTNLISNMESHYRWKGQLQKSKEVVMLIKTLKKNESKVINLIKKLHSYEVPCVVSLKIAGGNQDFLRWIQAEVK